MNQFFSLQTAIIFFLFIQGLSLHSESYNELFSLYLKNDLDAERLRLETEIARNNLKKFQLENLLKLSIAIGTSSRIAFDGTDTTMKFAPELSLSLPEWRNTEFSMSAPITIPLADPINNFDIQPDFTIKTDIYPFQKKICTTDLEKLTLQRTILTAERSLNEQLRKIETDFLTLLREVFQTKYDITSAQLDYSDAQRDLLKAKTEGYGENSLEYKRLQLNLKKKSREVREKERIYQTALNRLSKECGISIQVLPNDIPEPDLKPISNYLLERYKNYEEAVWAKKRGDMEREISKARFQLSGAAGYRYGATDGRTDLSKTHYLGTGLEMSYNGFSAEIGIDLPVDHPEKPELTFSFGWNPMEIFTNRINNKNIVFKENIDKIDIAKAIREYDIQYDDLFKEREDLIWLKNVYAEEELLYKEQAEEYQKRYNLGYINQADYERGQVEYQNALTQNILGRIDRMIFMSNLEILFLPEDSNQNSLQKVEKKSNKRSNK